MPESRVEKYKEYRQEIQNSFSEKDLTTKKKTSDRVNKILNEQDQEHALEKSSANSISYKELMGAYELYDKDKKEDVSPLINKRRRQVRYIAFAGSVLLVLLIATIVVGVIAFGGK